MRYNKYSGKFEADNFSFYVNSWILERYSWRDSSGDENCAEIKKCIVSLIENCKDFHDRVEGEMEAISSLFTDSDTIAELQSAVYLDTRGFVSEIMKKKKLISEVDFPDVVSQLQNLQDIMAQIENTVKMKREEKKTNNNERSKQFALLKKASFFKKIGIKKIIRELNKRDQEIDEEITSLEVPEEAYNLAMSAILKAKSNKNVQQIDAQSYGIPKKYVEIAKKVYLMCEERHITALKTEDEMELFRVICQDQKLPKKYQNADLFNCGAQEAVVAARKKNREKYRESRIKRTVEYNEEKGKTLIIGRAKYVQKVIEEKAQVDKMEQATQLLGELAELQTQTRTVKSDAAIFGGIANGLAGAAAGIATYAEIERENIKAEANAAEIRRRGYENLSATRALEENYRDVSRGLGYIVDVLKARLCDTSNSGKYFSYLNCRVESYSVEFDGTMTLDIKIEFAKEPEMNGIPIAIDGSLRINIKSEDKKIGEAYVCAPGFDEVDLKRVGFGARKHYSAIGIPKYSDFEIHKEYSFEIEPVSVWMIEK